MIFLQFRHTYASGYWGCPYEMKSGGNGIALHFLNAFSEKKAGFFSPSGKK